MSTLERELINCIDSYKKEHGEEPKFVNVLIRWKDNGIVAERTVALFPYDESTTPNSVDDNVFFYFDGVSEMIFCLSNVEEVYEGLFDSREGFETELNKYAETEEDERYYFPSCEDFDIVQIISATNEI